MLAGYCAAQPLLRLITGNSAFNLNEDTAFAPFEITALIIETLTWFSMIILILLETKVYIRQFRWLVRFRVIYVLVGDIVMLDLLLSVKDYCNRSALFLYISTVICQVLFGTLLLVYIPNLVPYSGQITMPDEVPDNGEYEPLCGENQVCPEMRANLLSTAEGVLLDDDLSEPTMGVKLATLSMLDENNSKSDKEQESSVSLKPPSADTVHVKM